MTGNKSETKYPECEKMSAVQNESRTLSGFLDWLDEEELIICKDEGEKQGYWPSRITKERLIAKFFDIDLDKVEKERRAILDEIRKGQDETTPPA